MKPSDVFTVIVRTVGLLVCLTAGAALFYALINLIFSGPVNAVGLAIVGLPSFLVGLWMLRGAPSLIAFAFPESKEQERD